MRVYFLGVALLFLGVLQASEPSAFGAGNLDNPEPYGLTTTEKKIVENRDSLKNTKLKSQENRAQLQSLRERIDGLQTIVEGLTEKAQQNKMTLGGLDQDRADAQTREQRLQALEVSIQTQMENLAALKGVLESLATQVEKINTEYVSKDEFNRLVNDVNTFKSELSKTLKSVAVAPAQDPYTSLSSKQLAVDAKAQYDKLYFKNAIPMYEELIRRDYKPAYAHYMIGEMWHYRKAWDKALSYYKESVKRYNNASYMPKLLLHSSQCMVHLGETSNAEKFLRTLIAKYPSSEEASEGEELLNTL